MTFRCGLLALALVLLSCTFNGSVQWEEASAEEPEKESQVLSSSDPQSPAATEAGLEPQCPPLEAGEPISPLRLRAEHVSSEASKDSNTTRRRADFDGRVLTYYGPHGPCQRGRCGHAEVQVLLLKSEVTELEAVVEKHDFWKSLTESRPNKVGSPSVTNSATIELSAESRSARSSVWSGWSRSTGERVEFGSPEARSRASSVGTLLRSLGRMAKRCYPELR